MKKSWNSTDAAGAGVFAVVAVVVCCGIPLLAGATSLAVTGVVFGGTAAAIGAAALVVFAIARAHHRARSDEGCCEPGSVSEVQPGEPMTTPSDMPA